MSLPKHICMLPWVSIETSPIGTARPCCMALDEIVDKNGIKYDLNTSTVVEIYKSEYMQQLRQQFRDGKKPQTCKRCWDEEAAGRTSKRMHTQIRLKELVNKVEWDNDLPDQLWFLDLKLGNICNLKCRICGSWSSSKWAEEELAYMPKGFNKKTHIAYEWLKQGAWPRKSSVFWDNLRELLPNIKYLEFTGGEPWLIKEHFDLLQFAYDNGYSKNIDIHYNTNGTQSPEEYISLWKNFGRVDIAFSIDNVGSKFEYERYGANWEEVNKNIDLTHQYQKECPNITTQLCFTINIQNVFYLDELLHWAITKKFGNIYFNMMHSPSHLSIQYLTPTAKELVLKKLNETDWLTNEFKKEILSITKFIEAGPGSDGAEFLLKMKKADEYRQQNFTETHPEIAKAMGYN